MIKYPTFRAYYAVIMLDASAHLCTCTYYPKNYAGIIDSGLLQCCYVAHFIIFKQLAT